jgi:hypothetical protein
MDQMRGSGQHDLSSFVQYRAHPGPVRVILGRIQCQYSRDFRLVHCQHTWAAVVSLRHLDQHPCISFKYVTDVPGRSSFLLGYPGMIPLLPFNHQLGHQCQPQKKEHPFNPTGGLQIHGADPQRPREEMLAARDVRWRLEAPQSLRCRGAVRGQGRDPSVHPLQQGGFLHVCPIDGHPEFPHVAPTPEPGPFVPLAFWLVLQHFLDALLKPLLGPSWLPHALLPWLQPPC